MAQLTAAASRAESEIVTLKRRLQEKDQQLQAVERQLHGVQDGRGAADQELQDLRAKMEGVQRCAGLLNAVHPVQPPSLTFLLPAACKLRKQQSKQASKQQRDGLSTWCPALPHSVFSWLPRLRLASVADFLSFFCRREAAGSKEQIQRLQGYVAYERDLASQANRSNQEQEHRLQEEARQREVRPLTRPGRAQRDHSCVGRETLCRPPFSPDPVSRPIPLSRHAIPPRQCTTRAGAWAHGTAESS